MEKGERRIDRGERKERREGRRGSHWLRRMFCMSSKGKEHSDWEEGRTAQILGHSHHIDMTGDSLTEMMRSRWKALQAQ